MNGAAVSLAVVWHEAYEADIGVHVFPTRKYRAVRDRLVAEGTIADADILRPGPAADEDVATCPECDAEVGDEVTRCPNCGVEFE